MLDERTGLYYCKGGRIIDLSMREALLLSTLIFNKGKVCTYQMLADEVYGTDNDEYLQNLVKVIMHHLRNKLAGEVKIHNKFGIGYFVGRLKE